MKIDRIGNGRLLTDFNRQPIIAFADGEVVGTNPVRCQYAGVGGDIVYSSTTEARLGRFKRGDTIATVIGPRGLVIVPRHYIGPVGFDNITQSPSTGASGVAALGAAAAAIIAGASDTGRKLVGAISGSRGKIALDRSKGSKRITGAPAVIGVDGFRFPVENGTITSGTSNVYRGVGSGKHKGWDITGTPAAGARHGWAVAAEAGRIHSIYVGAGYGRVVVLKGDSGNFYLYAHLASSIVSEGQRVNAGDRIAAIGGSNAATTNGAVIEDGYVPHLHFEVRKSPLFPSSATMEDADRTDAFIGLFV